jgi:hypothetical protein
MKWPADHWVSIRMGFIGFAFLLSLAAPSCKSQTVADSVDDFLRTNFSFSRDDLSGIERGKVVTKMLKSDSPAEVAVCGAMHLRIPVDVVVKMYRRLEISRIGSAVVDIGKLGEPARMEDLEHLTLEDEDIKALRTCRPGASEVKLSTDQIRRFQKEIDWNSTDYRDRVSALMKKILLDYVKAYRAAGNNKLAEYDDQGYSLFMADEFHEILHETPALFTYGTGMFEYLERYPSETLPNATESIYWQKEKFEKIKPIISLNDVTVYTPVGGKADALIATKQIYANHYYEASLTMTALIRDRARSQGFYLLYLNRSRFDDLRRKGVLDYDSRIRSEIFKRVQSELQWTRAHIQMLYQMRER